MTHVPGDATIAASANDGDDTPTAGPPASMLPFGTSDQGGPASPLRRMHAPYFVQSVKVSRDLVGLSRNAVLTHLCAGQRVLHVGCADWPITDPSSSLHVALDAHCARLDGFDVHPEAFNALRPHVRGQFFSDWQDVTDEYDIVLAPEVMEHVGDVPGFLASLDAVRSRHVILTVPDAYQCHRRHFDYEVQTSTFVEVVHPDHHCWYTPYTFVNAIRKFTDWEVAGVYFFNNISLLGIMNKPEAATPTQA